MTITDAIHIDATPDVVWAVTQDVERWPEWTPTVTSVKLLGNKSFRLGSVARIKQPMQPESEWVVTEFSSGRRFAWETRRTGLHMTGTHELAPEGAGTRNVLRVDANGAMAVMLWPLLRLAMRKALADENLGLKARCEQTSSAAASR
jgi:carbon monoxide dehydrogenase subunit G